MPDPRFLSGFLTLKLASTNSSYELSELEMWCPELASGDVHKRKKPEISLRLFDFKIGIDILSRALDQVPSALVGLTSLFGMGRGDPHRNRRHKGM